MYSGCDYPYKSCFCTFWPCHPYFILQFYSIAFYTCICYNYILVSDIGITTLLINNWFTHNSKAQSTPKPIMDGGWCCLIVFLLGEPSLLLASVLVMQYIQHCGKGGEVWVWDCVVWLARLLTWSLIDLFMIGSLFCSFLGTVIFACCIIFSTEGVILCSPYMYK